jgi:hypothetical protein
MKKEKYDNPYGYDYSKVEDESSIGFSATLVVIATIIVIIHALLIFVG